MKMYEPAEDSYMLKEAVKLHCESFRPRTVLDMGTGSGIQAIEARKHAKKVIATDIDEETIKELRKNKRKLNKITIIKSNLFNSLGEYKNKFNLIIFNPPYLPKADTDAPDKALDGGKTGNELTIRFLQQADGYLAENGRILFIASSLSKPEEIEKTMDEKSYEWKLLGKKHFFFEGIMIYEAKKITSIFSARDLKKILTGKVFLAKGKRGIAYLSEYRKHKYLIKTKNPCSEAVGTIRRESEFNKLLNKHKIGPRFHYYNSKEDYLIREYVEGTPIIKWIEQKKKERNSNEQIKSIILSILDQSRAMDKIGVNKQEMTNPYKDIIIRKGKPIIIDFERCTTTSNPKNVTQFCQFISSGKLSSAIGKQVIDREKMIMLTREYKNKYDPKSYNKIRNYIKKNISQTSSWSS